MIKRLLFLIAIIFTTNVNTSLATALDTSYSENLTPFDWTPISDADKVIGFVKESELTKRTTDQVKKATPHYNDGIKYMVEKDYASAITEFKAAMKRYKRARLPQDAMNFINVNMALAYANSGNKEDKAVAERLLNLITKEIKSDNNWAYNIAIAHYYTESPQGINTATSLLSKIIRKDRFYFQAYITLEAIYRNSGNENDADKVRDRMETAEEKLYKKNQKVSKKDNTKKVAATKQKDMLSIRKAEPDITNLTIVKNDDPLQFNKKDKIKDREMEQIQEGIGEYNTGLISLENRNFKASQKPLKDAEKRLKRGKVTEDGLNFVRGNLAIDFLAQGKVDNSKRSAGQARRYLKYLTSKLYKDNALWSYNMAVAYYQFALMSARKNKKAKEGEPKIKWDGAKSAEAIKQSIKLFEKSISQDKSYLPAYRNLLYIYEEITREFKKAKKIQEAGNKAQLKLMQSFSKEKQKEKGLEAYIFRINLGTFGNFETPADVFYETNLIAIPMPKERTTYLTGLFYTLDEASEYQKRMQKRGYTNCFIVGYKDGQDFTVTDL